MKKTYYLIIILFLLASCSSLDDAAKVLKNEKIKTTDEFLVKKRKPLIMPPNFEEIPEPGSIAKTKENEEDKIKKIFKVPEIETQTSSQKNSIEQSVLNRIKK